jgi:hypothetical protein
VRKPKETATMADSLTEKANKTETKEDAPMEEEFHNAATVCTGENITLTGDRWKELHLLIEITCKNETEARTSSQKHLMVLQALGDTFNLTELKIFDQKSRDLPLEQYRKMRYLANNEHRFTIHQGKNYEIYFMAAHCCPSTQCNKLYLP